MSASVQLRAVPSRTDERLYVTFGPDFPPSRDALHETFRGLPSAHRGNLPCATEASSRVLCLPIYPERSDADIGRVVGIIESC